MKQESGIKYRVGLARFVGNGTHRHEVGSFLAYLVEQCCSPGSTVAPYIETLPDGSRYFDIPVQAFPTDVARNRAILAAQQSGISFLFMVDDDCYPSNAFFEYAFHFLREQEEPSVIAVPYCAADGEVQVFRFTTRQPSIAGSPLESWALTRYPREEAFHKAGVERVASIGTHLVAYDLRVFDKISKPYFKYGYDPDHVQILETEDCYCHRNLFNAGVPIFCSWDHWAGHWKSQLIGAPEPLKLEQIPEFYLRKARAALQQEQSTQLPAYDCGCGRQPGRAACGISQTEVCHE